MTKPPPKNYKVGYKKPPKKGQFTKGQSGNAGGRPRKPAFDSDDLLISLVEAKVGDSEMPVLGLLYKSSIKTGLQGDMKAINFVVENYRLAKRRRKSSTTDDDGDRAIIQRLFGPDHPLIKELDLTGDLNPDTEDAEATDEPSDDE